MKETIFATAAICAVVIACQTQAKKESVVTAEATIPKPMHELNGYQSKEAWGEHLVKVIGCDDCHSPKTMTDHGPMPDPALRLSGHPADAPAANLDRTSIEQNGYGACNSHMTAWLGPWGVSYASNITSDATGIGNWTEEQFFRAMREGKYKGMKEGRMLLPPMPWFNFANMTDEELSALFAYLKTVPAVENLVPAPQGPITAMK